MLPLSAETDVHPWVAQPGLITSPKGPSFVKTEPLVRPSSRVMGLGSTDPDDLKPAYFARSPTLFEEQETSPQHAEYEQLLHTWAADDTQRSQQQRGAAVQTPSIHLKGRVGSRSISSYAPVSPGQVQGISSAKVTSEHISPHRPLPSPPRMTSHLPQSATHISAPQSREYLDYYQIAEAPNNYPLRLRSIFSEDTLKQEAGKRERLRQGMLGDMPQIPMRKYRTGQDRAQDRSHHMPFDGSHAHRQVKLHMVPEVAEIGRPPARVSQDYVSLGDLRSYRLPMASDSVGYGTRAQPRETRQVYRN